MDSIKETKPWFSHGKQLCRGTVFACDVIAEFFSATDADVAAAANDRIAALEAALKPFADVADKLKDSWSDDTSLCLFSIDGSFTNPTLGDCRKALEVLRDK